MTLNIHNFLWANLFQTCVDNRVYIDNYPHNVLLPSVCKDKDEGRSKGIANIKKQEWQILIEAINASTNPLRFIKVKSSAGSIFACSFHIDKPVTSQYMYVDINNNCHPVLIYAPPHTGSKQSHSKWVFINGQMDEQGHPHVDATKGSNRLEGPTLSADDTVLPSIEVSSTKKQGHY